MYNIGCTGLAASTGALAILLSLCIGVFSTVTILNFVLKQRKGVKLNPLPLATLEGGETGRDKFQSPEYDEILSVIHPSPCVTIENIAYSSAIKH